MIQHIRKTIVQTLKAQQHVQTIYNIAKDLIENSLDSNATSIKIYLSHEKIIAEDDGDGIEDLNYLGKDGYTSKHETSKIAVGLQHNENIEPKFMYGFRGTALFSISLICDLEILSSTGLNAYKKDFTNNKISIGAREKGTTVFIKNIFKNCDIRRRNIEKSYKSDVNRIVKLLKNYCMIRNINFVLHDQKKIIYDRGNGNLCDYLTRNYKYEFLNVENDTYIFYLAKTSVSNRDQRFIFLRDRPVSITGLSKKITSVFNNFISGYPFFVLIIKVNGDFNIDVDKSKGYLENEMEVFSRIKCDIEKHFSETQYQVQKNIRKPLMELNSINNSGSTSRNVEMLKKKVKSNFDSTKYSYVNDIKIYSENTNMNCGEENRPNSISDDKIQNNFNIGEISSKKNTGVNKSAFTNENIDIYHSDEEKVVSKKHDLENHIAQIKDENLNEINKTPNNKIVPEIQLSFNKRLKLDLTDNQDSDNESDLETKLDFFERIFDSSLQENESYEILKNNLDDIIHIEKSDIKNLKVIGQYNKGFILTKLHKNNNIYLIIVDQHAADEIYNYENLINNFKFKRQQLIVPLDIKGNIYDEFYIKSNKEMINKNGFEIDDDLKLRAVPMYKNTIFNQNDLWDLLSRIENSKEDEVVFCQRMKDVIASKACRMSIMIGTGLRLKQMERILENLANLNVPWMCPHGRPILRVLYYV